MHLIGRRNFLAGVGLGAGSYLLGSIWKTLVPEALGAVPGKRRFIGYILTHSTPMEYLPGGAGGPIALGDIYASMEPFKNEVLFLSQLFYPMISSQHIPNSPLSLVATGRKDYDVADALSFDRMLAQTIGKGDPQPSINLCPDRTSGDPISRPYSADGPGKPFPAVGDTVKAFNQVFRAGLAAPAPAAGGGAVAGAADLERVRRREGRLLDLLREDVGRMNRRLAGPEREKLERYLESIDQLEKRLTDLGSGGGANACAMPPKAPASDPGTNIDARFEAITDLAVMAFACGLTRVVLLTLARDTLYPHIGPRAGNHDDFFHDGSADVRRKYFTYHAQKFARIRQRLAEIPEGSGTLADGTLGLMYNASGAQHHGNKLKFWTLTFGTMGGALKGGRSIQYPESTRSVSDAFTTFSHALGLPQNFGGECKGPIPEIMG
jgi:hypothetical protein